MVILKLLEDIFSDFIEKVLAFLILQAIDSEKVYHAFVLGLLIVLIMCMK